MLKKILILFPEDWDRRCFSTPELRERYRFFFESFDLFTFPHPRQGRNRVAAREKHRLIKQKLDFETGSDALPEAANASP